MSPLAELVILAKLLNLIISAAYFTYGVLNYTVPLLKGVCRIKLLRVTLLRITGQFVLIAFGRKSS